MTTKSFQLTLLECLNHIGQHHPEHIATLAQLLTPQLLSQISAKESVRSLITRYCHGFGLEIGPGNNPYCQRETTVFLDKYDENLNGNVPNFIKSDGMRIPFPDSHFDYVFSSHVLEHMQDTIGALNAWARVLKSEGTMFLVLPHGDRTFDRHRKKTTLEHHIRDHQTLTDEFDWSHNDEIKAGWSLNEDFESSAKEYVETYGVDFWDFDFRLRNSIIHFHVWTQDELVKLLQYMNFKILRVIDYVDERPDSFLIVSQKP